VEAAAPETYESGVAPDWAAAMREGAFARAWAISDRHLAALLRDPPRKHGGPRQLQRIWRGEPLADRRVLVRCYHGLGDTIQFARFLPALGALASDLTVWCQPELIGLIETMPNVDRVIALHDGAPAVPFEVDIEIMEIPHALRAGIGLVRSCGAYLTLPECKVAPRRPPRPLSVGVVWQAGDWDKRRSVPRALLRSLRHDGVDLHSLQLNGGDAADLLGGEDLSTPDFVELGRTICALDLVICVDTMVAHLTGALDRPGLVMLHADCDWRWPLSGRRSIWYPTLRLFHQHNDGEWSSVIAQMRSALEAIVNASNLPVHSALDELPE
jgi:hypothetical protein